MAVPIGYKHSPDARKKMSLTHRRLKQRPPSWLGKKHSEETKAKMSETRKRIGQTSEQIEKLIKRNKDPLFWTEERREKIGKSRKGKKNSPESIEKMRLKLIGKKRSDEQRKRISDSLKGSKSSFWKGGITKEHQRIGVFVCVFKFHPIRHYSVVCYFIFVVINPSIGVTTLNIPPYFL